MLHLLVGCRGFVVSVPDSLKRVVSGVSDLQVDTNARRKLFVELLTNLLNISIYFNYMLKNKTKTSMIEP